MTAKERSAEELAKVSEEKFTLEEERVFRRGVVNVRELIAPASFSIDPTFVRLGDLYCRTIFVITYPRYLAVGWSAPIIGMNRSLDIGNEIFIRSKPK